MQKSEDSYLLNNQLLFKVKCTLENNYLVLPNGFKVYLRKGMTLQANFIVTKHSLFQLLYDKSRRLAKSYETDCV